jgi:predicted nucleic acid-binding Zn ribbon protein
MPKHLTEMSEKNCLECSTPLGPGRSDRKFCNDICRTAYNKNGEAKS